MNLIIYLLWNATSKLPANSRLDSEDDVLHLDFVVVFIFLGASISMFSIDAGICEDMLSISVGELEQLVKNCRLGVLDGGCGGEEEGDGAGCWREVVDGTRHGWLLGLVWRQLWEGQGEDSSIMHLLTASGAPHSDSSLRRDRLNRR